MITYEIQYIDRAGRLVVVQMEANSVLALMNDFIKYYAPVTVINSIVRMYI